MRKSTTRFAFALLLIGVLSRAIPSAALDDPRETVIGPNTMIEASPASKDQFQYLIQSAWTSFMFTETRSRFWSTRKTSTISLPAEFRTRSRIRTFRRVFARSRSVAVGGLARTRLMTK